MPMELIAEAGITTGRHIPNPTLELLKIAIEAGVPASWLDVQITKPMARLMLRYNKSTETNRKLSPKKVKDHAASLDDGRWINTGEPLIFSDEALLNDGQHRLEGFLASTKSVLVCDIRFGIKRRAFLDTNTGKSRNASDALLIAGLPSTTIIGAIARAVRAYHRGMPSGLFLGVDNRTVVEMVETDDDLTTAYQMTQTLPRQVRLAVVGAVLYMALKVANRATVEEFHHILKTGEGSAANPAHRLRETLLAQTKARHTNQGRVVTYAICVQAWNAWHAGKPAGRWYKPSDGGFPQVVKYPPSPAKL